MQSQYSNMTLQEKLDLIDEELKKVHLCCTIAGYTASEIERFAQPFFNKDTNGLGSVSWPRVKAFTKQCVAVVVVLVFFYMYPPANTAICGITRIGVNKILPGWFWNFVSDNGRCLLGNPLYDRRAPSIMDCEVCEMIEELERLRDVDSEYMRQLKRECKPVIVEDASVNWTNNSDITIAQLAEMYNTHPVLKERPACKFRSNVKSVSEDHITLLDEVVTGNIDRFYAHWRNCDISAAKVLRQIYTLPYFLPSIFHPPLGNWILISSNYSGIIWKPIHFKGHFLLVIQLKGQNLINISSGELCKPFCPTLEATLSQGEVLVVPNCVWDVEYLPSNSPENIAVLVEVDI